MSKRIPLRLAIAALGLVQVAAAQTSLEAGFKSPPTQAKPMTWWHWINGNISKPGITADLEAMKRIGLAGAQIFNVEVGIPVGDTPFMTPQWKDALAWAFKEAKRLGLTLDVHNCAGWSSSGGPWVKPQYAMQNLTWSETLATGGTKFEGVLPKPASRLGYYRDVACYAVKSPENEAFRLDRIRQKVGFDRGDHISADSTMVPTNAFIPTSDVLPVDMDATGKVSIDLPEGKWTIIRMGHTPTGAVNAPAPIAGRGPEVDKLSREALDAFWQGMMKTAVEANGKIGKAGLIGALIDSYEVGSQTWTPKFREEFMKRRGYDPMPYMPCVTGRVVKDGDTTERFLWDYRRTICDLFADNYFGYMAELCHRHGLRFATEGYGNGDFDNIQVNGRADLPMAEFWIGGAARETTKMVASSAHVYGKPVVGAESFTADTPHARWLYDPYSIKALGDQVFTYGVNRYIFHRYTHQPWLNLEPGMTMGPWGMNFERTITWWNQGKAWIDYIARCQYLLQSGRFTADVLAFSGDEGPNDMGLLYGDVVPRGYDYDGCDSQALQGARVENGQIVLPSGMRYRMLVLPDSVWMTNRTMKKVDALVRAGATIVGRKPLHTPSLGDGGDAFIEKAADALWSSDAGQKRIFATLPEAIKACGLAKDVDANRALNWIHRKVGSDDVYFVANPKYAPIDVDVTFRVAGKSTEVWNPETGQTSPAAVWRGGAGSTTVQLRLESAGSTFVVFRNRKPTSHATSVVWTGKGDAEPKPPKIAIVSARYEAEDGAGGTDVTAKITEMIAMGEMNVAATNSNFGDPTVNHVKRLHVVYTIDGKRTETFVPENGSLDLAPASRDDTPPKFSIEGGRIDVWRNGGVGIQYGDKTIVAKATVTENSVSGPWKVNFPAGKGAPAQIAMTSLGSLSESKIDGVKYFSGTATYRTTFTQKSVRKSGGAYWLDLGRVKNFAEVTINGHNLPTLWKAPFRVDVTPWLKAGRNTLEVKVTNLWPNRIIGDERLPKDAEYKGPIQKWPDWLTKGRPRPKTGRVTFATWEFFNKNSPLLESGLIGPVRVVRTTSIKIVDR